MTCIRAVRKQKGVIKWMVVANDLAKHGYMRTNIQCRLRWNDVLRPGLRLGKWTSADDAELVVLHQKHGNSWNLFSDDLRRSSTVIRTHFHNMEKRVDRYLARQEAALKSGPLFDYIHR